jgi:hypothetical protein
VYRLLSITVLLIAACRTAPPTPPCSIPEGLHIRWGVWNDSLGVLEGYQLEPSGRVLHYRQGVQTGQQTLLDTLPQTIERRTHCDVAISLRNAFIQNQTYVVIGPRSHYVEYATPSATLRAVWDARYETYGSRHFRAIFRWLNHLIGLRDEAAHR